MLRHWIAALAVALTSLLLGGCPVVQPNPAPQTANRGGTSVIDALAQQNSGRQLTLRDVLSARAFPSVPSANIRVIVANESDFVAQIRLTMRVAGQRVHFSSRTIAGGAELQVAGPDQADSVLLEATLRVEDGLTLPIETRFLNVDFNNGDTVRFVLRSPIASDCDGNGIDDSTEIDRDNDGRIDACDECPDDPNKTVPGACGCGVQDTDSDGDGTPDCMDECPTDPEKILPGECGCGAADADSDHDGVLDCLDQCEDQDDLLDSDGDHIADCRDGCPNDPHKVVPGSCGCGVEDVDENENGIADCLEPLPLQITILHLDADVRVSRDGRVDFRIRIVNAGQAAEIRAFARRIGEPDAPDIPALLGPPSGEELEASLFTSGLAPGAYEIFAEVRDEQRVASVVAVGRVLVNSEPTLAFDSPAPEQLVSTRAPFVVAWAGADDDDDASIDIFLDPDQERNGNEIVLRTNVSEDDVEDRQTLVDGRDIPLPAGDYFVGGAIRDPLGETVVYAQRICVRDRLVGRIQMSALRDELKVLTATHTNRELGFSLDMSRDADGDGVADLLVGDPSAGLPGETNGTVEEFGAAYLFTRVEEMEGEFPAASADVAYINRDSGAHLGERVAMISLASPRLAGYPYGFTRLVLGAPRLSTDGANLGGRAYLVPAWEDSPFELCCRKFPELTFLDGDALDFAGADLAALGDVTGDGFPDFAIGATRLSNIGLVGIVSGGQGLPYPGRLSQQAFRITGHSILGFFGSVIRPIRDLDGDEIDEMLVGEPFGGAPDLERTGRAYIIYGSHRFAEPGAGGVKSGEFRVRSVFGEVVDDGAGYSLASGDFDGDGRPDLLVGAPFHAGNRGRAYLIYDIGDEGMPDIIHLSDVGSEALPGVIFDGVEAGELFGISVANIGDFDADGYEDIAIGASQARGGRGVVRVVFGGPQRLSGLRTFETFACGFDAAELADDRVEDGLFGAAISAGDVTNDGGTDLGIGAPTELRTGGALYLIAGQAQNR